MEKLETIAKTIRGMYPNASIIFVTIYDKNESFKQLPIPEGFETIIGDKFNNDSDSSFYVINGVKFNLINK